LAQKRTIEDIARLAGVSRTTVSRVLNRRPDVDRGTRERVLRIIEEESYVPSPAAIRLAGGHNRLIGMLLPAFTWPIVPDLVRGITEILKQTPYELVLYTYNDEDLNRDRRDVINRLLATQLTAGLLAVYPGQLAVQLTELFQRGVPVVIIDDQQEHVTPWICPDNVAGAYTAVHHLVELGHRRIAHIQGPQEYLCTHERHQGYLRALIEAGIEPDPELVVGGDFLPGSGYVGAGVLLDLPPERRPTAIFAAADQMAYGAIRAAEERGISVPEGLALVGFDDDAPSAHVQPPLTTVRQPSFEMGQQGMELLLKMVEASEQSAYDAWISEKSAAGRKVEPRSKARLVLSTSLIVRASCGAPYPNVDVNRESNTLGGRQ
jgi:LacI family transcriptional regulator